MKQTTACQAARMHLDAFADSELDAATMEDIGRHVEECAECAVELNTIRLLKARVHTAVKSNEISPEFRTRIVASLRDGRAPSRATRQWAPLAAAAMIAVAFGLSWTVYQNWSGTTGPAVTADRYVNALKARVAAVVYTAMTDHIHCAVFRDYSKNPPSREQMVSDMGPQFKDLIPIVRDKVPAAYRLEQAHRCTSGGREYVHLIFRDRLALISVIATIRKQGESVNELPAANQSGRIRATSVDQYQVAAFDAGKFMAYVVSDLPRNENVVVADALVSPMSSFLGQVSPVRVF